MNISRILKYCSIAIFVFAIYCFLFYIGPFIFLAISALCTFLLSVFTSKEYKEKHGSKKFAFRFLYVLFGFISFMFFLIGIVIFKETKPEFIGDTLNKAEIKAKKVSSENVFKISPEELTALKSNQKKWADSMLKIWEGYVVRYEISEDAKEINFYLNKKNKGSNGTEEFNKSIFQKEYIKSFPSQSFETNVYIKLDPETQKIVDEEREIQHRVNQQFAGFEESNHYLVSYVKQNMNDPSSFEHIETSFKFNKKTQIIDVYMRFRGSNAFGAVVVNSVRAKIDLDGNILSVTQ